MLWPPISYFIVISIACTAGDPKRSRYKPYCKKEVNCTSACQCSPNLNCTLLPMDDPTRKQILFYINSIRHIQTGNEITPAGLTVLQYNLYLEDLSVCSAVTCDTSNLKCFLTPNFSETSQAFEKTPVKDGYSSVDLWYELMSLWLAEIEVINERAIQNIPRNEAGTRIDNFAQVLSDRVLYVGCSWSRSVDWMLFVCTFAPRGPYLEEPIYKIGPICSSCPYGFACNYREPYEKLCKPGTMGLTKKVTLQSNNNSRASNLQELEFPKRSDEESKKDSKEKKNPILLAIIIFMGFSIFICIFLSIVFLIIHYLLNW